MSVMCPLDTSVMALVRDGEPRTRRSRMHSEAEPVNPERWRQIERIYHLALDRPPHERDLFLNSQCHGDPTLRLELDLLLGRTASAENFLDEPAITVAAQLMGRPEPPVMPAQIGRYRVTGKLGEAEWVWYTRRWTTASDGRLR